MTVAYLIRAHHRPAQLVRLIDRLDSPSARFLVHVSARTSEETYGSMREAVGERPNLVWTPRVETYYAGFSLVEATLAGLRESVRLDPEPGHTLVLSGQDYPIKTRGEIEAFVAAGRGTTFAEHFRIPTESPWRGEAGGLNRIRHVHFERLPYRTRLARLPLVRRRFPRGFEPFGGSALVAFSTEAVRYVLRFVEENPRFVRFFRHVMIPDEIFFQTVLMNSPLRESVENRQLHYVDWSAGSAHPAVLTREALPALRASAMLFARKFDVKEDAEVLDAIDRELLA